MKADRKGSCVVQTSGKRVKCFPVMNGILQQRKKPIRIFLGSDNSGHLYSVLLKVFFGCDIFTLAQTMITKEYKQVREY